MVETDWREILSFSQKELNNNDKEKLCESISWMEADDIELNFTDLKTLFRLAQDILKYKSEQVNTMLGKMETIQRKHGKKKPKHSYEDSPSRDSGVFETIAHQEEIIKANKDILEQLYIDIAELKDRKKKLNKKDENADRDSDSSRGVLSEMNAIEQLENQVTMKNRHIRKLLTDVKIIEEENVHLKEKASILKEKLTEATQIIENLTDQMFTINHECTMLKELLGKAEETKAKLSVEIESMKVEMSEKESGRDNVLEEIRSKVQHWKNITRTKIAENETLMEEISQLKHALGRKDKSHVKTKGNEAEVKQLQDLQDKLLEATNEIIASTKLIENLKAENKQLKSMFKEADAREISNESDEGKERALNIQLKKKVASLEKSLKEAEDMITFRDKELAEITSQLNLLKSGEKGLKELLDSLKSKKRQLRLKDTAIKSLVQNVNTLNQTVDELELKNELMRKKLNIAPDAKISTKGFLKKHQDLEKYVEEMQKTINTMENKLISLEIENRKKTTWLNKMTKLLQSIGYNSDKIEKIYHDSDEEISIDVGAEATTVAVIRAHEPADEDADRNAEMRAVIEENEGLRKGLQEILDFIKDNSTSSSGILALKCPSLEAVLRTLEARHSAGWYAPHMTVLLELRTALGGRDALLTALHEARKETFDVILQLSEESKKSQELEQRLQEIERNNKSHDSEEQIKDDPIFASMKIGSWVSAKEVNAIDFYDKTNIENLIKEGNVSNEKQLQNSLAYFHNRFKELFDKMTVIAIQSADEQNKWFIQEEQYKAEIENLKVHLNIKDDEDKSDDSPGLLYYPSSSVLHRRCAYLEEAYIYTRTIIENIKNENLNSKKEAMMLTADYEMKIQRLILYIASLTDKLSNSISLDLFWKQNEALNDISLKYNKLANENFKQLINVTDIQKKLDNDKTDIINTLQNEIERKLKSNENGYKNLLTNVEQTIYQQQIQRLCSELEIKQNLLKKAENKIFALQEDQAKIINKAPTTTTKEDLNAQKLQLEEIINENIRLKDQCQHVGSQLDIALLQLQDTQQRQMSRDIEVNMLRHQILDLQSAGEDKAIIAKLSGEILVAHLQATETHKKMERLKSALNKEIQKRVEAEEMLKARENIFNIYTKRHESKFRYIFEVIQILRQQYQNCLPVISIENYLNNIEDHHRKMTAVDYKLNEIEDLQSNLLIKNSALDEILQLTKAKCLEDEDNCPHKIKLIVSAGIHVREKKYLNERIYNLEQSREEFVKQFNSLEKTLVLVNQGFEKTPLDEVIEKKISNKDVDPLDLELEDIQSDDDSRKSQTITLPKPQLLKSPKPNADMTKTYKGDNTYSLPGSPVKQIKSNIATANVFVQTAMANDNKNNKFTQTDADKEIKAIKTRIKIIQKDFEEKSKELSEALNLVQRKTEEILSLNKEKSNTDNVLGNLRSSVSQQDRLIVTLQRTITDLNKELEASKSSLNIERNKLKDAVNEESRTLLTTLRKLEEDKNKIVEEYKQIMNKERDNYLKTVKELNSKIIDLKSQLDRKDSNPSSTEAVKEVVSKYSVKIVELEEKCFMQQSELEGSKTEILTYKNEAERWKELAAERLSKMEQLNAQMQERHCHEMESYKAESQHWLTQLNDTQKEHMDLRNQLSEQKAMYVKQMSEKDAQIEHMRTLIHNLRSQIMNMQTMMSINDPSFDLSAIVEVEDSDVTSQRGSDRLEIRYDSSPDMRDDLVVGPTSSSNLWQDSVLERLRREKQLVCKQNNILRRQIKALASRERRARLEVQNLKNQVFRIGTSGSKPMTADAVSLQAKIVTLQTQLTSAKRETHSHIALWEKCKKAQQSAERWQARYEEKCREVKKLETNTNYAKSAVARLDREKRLLMTRLADAKKYGFLGDKETMYEKQELEPPEKICDTPRSELDPGRIPAHVTTQSLMDRIEVQQRRIVALELADKGNEPLVNEYERVLAENTALKGQLLKMESALLESQMRIPILSTSDPQPELEYLKSYCDMLKEENTQLSLRLSAYETAPASTQQHRVNDLEQTVLTLRGLVSKLQAEQKSPNHKRYDVRPPSGFNRMDKTRNQLESFRIEITNLKRSIQDKNNLLERSKQMLKIAAEREDELLRENSFLRRQIEELRDRKAGFLSV